MARKHKRRRSKRLVGGADSGRLPAPKTRLKRLFTLMTSVTTAGDQALMRIPADSKEVVRFDAAVLMRGVNAVKSTRLLLEQAHWESAAGPVRQLLELLVNMEYLAAQPDRDKAAFRYAKYGLLQTVLSQRAAMAYEKETGRAIDESRAATLDAERNLEGAFPEFRRVSTTGKVTWARTWSGKNTRALADESPNPLRQAQYQQLFAFLVRASARRSNHAS